MLIKFKLKPTYIHKDGRVEIKCEVDGEDHRIFLNIDEFMDFLDDELNALMHHVTDKTRTDS